MSLDLLGYAASLLMGVALGLTGGGGSILTLPILVYIFGYSPTVATGYSLFVVGATALVGSILYLRRGEVVFKIGAAFAVPSMIGVGISRGLILPRVPALIFGNQDFGLTKEILTMALFAGLMIAASYSMIRRGNSTRPQSARRPMGLAQIVLQGLIVGLIAGFVGAGGGFLIVPALVLGAGLSMRGAIGTSLVIIAVQSLFGFAGDILRGVPIEWRTILIVLGMAICGILVGSGIARMIDEQKLKVGFGWFVLLMGITIFIEQLRHLSI